MRNLFFVICALALTGFAVSCQSEEETTRSKDEAAVEFINTYNSTAEDVLVLVCGLETNPNLHVKRFRQKRTVCKPCM